MSITEEQLAELERLEREALPGPWRTGRHPDPSCDVAYVLPHGMPGEEAATIYLDDSERHAAFIVAARNALPALIQEVRRLRAVVDACARAGCPTAAEGKQATVYVTRFSNYEPAEIGEIYATREGAERSLCPNDGGWGWHVEEWKVLP